MHGDCGELGEIGVFEDITFPGFDPSIGQKQGVVVIKTDPIHTGTIFIGTSNQGFYKSTDCGAAWNKLDTGRNADVLDSGTLWNFVIDPLNPDTMYAGSLYSASVGLFKSINGGVDWDPIFSDEINDKASGSLQSTGMDPTDPLHIVVTFHDNCKSPYSSNCQGETTDGGETWRMINGPSQLSGWTEAAGAHVFGPDTWMIATAQNGCYFTDNAGATYEQIEPTGMGDLFRAADGTYYAASDYGMWRAADPSQWQKIPGPNGNPVISDGESLIVGIRFPWQADPDKHFFTAPESDVSTWSVFPSPALETVEGLGGPTGFAYDSDHQVLYISLATLGVRRLRLH